MHKLMADKGFEKKSRAEKMAEIQAKQVEHQLKGMESSVYQTASSLYLVVFVIAGVGGLFFCTASGRTKRRMAGTGGGGGVVSRV
ncbi:unnamed protein product [Pseudo-nitzschia multistriata]|uniref:Uncharacterized protein n=1 Tax=Pseudo-nitzschia multistriata TaxID=183589 RepID=A0A448ZGG7_9STRA|nr:unnamed protein product [Pseudo-nitzschia multistriata]